MPPIIVWFRQDLRLSDNPALHDAALQKRPVVALYILDPEFLKQMGEASRWWLHNSLAALSVSLWNKYQIQLVLAKGESLEVMQSLIQQTGANAVYWNRCYEPLAVKRDQNIKSQLARANIKIKDFKAALLFEGNELHNNSDQPFKVFTPFWKKLQQQSIRLPYPPPKAIIPFSAESRLSLDELQLLPRHAWYEKLSSHWEIGEMAAKAKLKKFLNDRINVYATLRDRPDISGTSKLSPHLHFGEISPFQIWHAARNCAKYDIFLSELAWREFSHHMLAEYPKMATQPIKQAFSHFGWEKNDQLLKKWQRGETGYPIVDAGMQELWQTGWMHNRVRMIVASFLVKDLLQPWQAGEAWFWETLVDADLASNAASWQWVTGCGLDSAPYFRVFNPTLQGKKFDPDGNYVRKWLPALRDVPNQLIHTPWEAPMLCADYPAPMIDHDWARKRALARYQAAIAK